MEGIDVHMCGHTRNLEGCLGLLFDKLKIERFNFQHTLVASNLEMIWDVYTLWQIMLAVLIALLTILTWHFTTVYTTRSIKTLAYGLRTELLNRPIARVWNLLNSTVEATLSQVQLSQFVLGQYALPISPAMQVEVSAST